MPSTTTRRAFLAQSALAAAAVAAGPAPRRPEDTPTAVFLITLDGLRPEEVFAGADEALMTKAAGVADVDRLRRRFWRDTAEDRRAALLPFFWGTLASEGQLLGNRDKGSVARVTNGKNFSYPGYNELLTGRPDGRIDSNDKRPNPNVTVLERVHRRIAPGRVAAFGCWDVFPFILNAERSGLPINAGWQPVQGDDLTDRQRLLNELNEEIAREWEGVRFDALTFAVALEHTRLHAPLFVYVGFGETDDFAHAGRYDRYLDAAHRTDRMIARLWKTLQSHPAYRGRASLLITTDHGRGPAPDGWKSHGADVPGSDAIWVAAVGPHTPALGERSDCEEVTQSLVAATAAAMLFGRDLRDELGGEPMAPPIADLLPRREP